MMKAKASILLFIFNAIIPVLAQPDGRTSAVLSAGLNLSGVQPLVESIRDDLLPEVVLAVNEFLDDNLSFSTLIGDEDFGIRVSAKIEDFVLNSNADTVELTLEDGVTSTSSTVRVSTSAMKLGAAMSSSVTVFLLGSSAGCSVGLSGGADLESFNIALGVSTGASNDISIGADEANFPSLGLSVRAQETGDACDVVSSLLATAISTVASALENLALPFLRTNLVKGLANVLNDSVVPIAQFETSVSVGNTGIIRPTFALETISSISNTFVVDVGASLGVELTQPAFRVGRSLTASSETTPNTMPQVSVERLIGMHLNLGSFNRMVESMWYLGRSFLAGDDDERLTQESTLCAEQAQPTDPCPFTPFSFSPGFFGDILLYILFFGRSNFRIETVLFPPAMDAASDELTGLVSSRVAILGSGLLGGEREVLATAAVDTILSTALPRYDGESGIISNVELTRIESVDFDLEYEGFPVFWFFSTFAKSLISSFAVSSANDFIDNANTEIAAFLQRTPLKIPAIRKFPTARTDMEFRLTNIALNGIPAGPDTDGFLEFDGGIDLAVLQREDAANISPPPTEKSVADMNSTVYREAYELAMQEANPNIVVSRSYSTSDGNMIVHTARWDDLSGSVQVFNPSTGVWSTAMPPQQ